MALGSASYPRTRRRNRGWWSASETTTGTVYVPRTHFLHVSFDNPPFTLTSGVNLQEWKLRVRKSATGIAPDFYADLYYSGSKVGTLIPTTSVTNKEGVVLSVQWNAATLPTLAGTGVEGRIVSTSYAPGVNVDIASFEWQPA